MDNKLQTTSLHTKSPNLEDIPLDFDKTELDNANNEKSKSRFRITAKLPNLKRSHSEQIPEPQIPTFLSYSSYSEVIPNVKERLNSVDLSAKNGSSSSSNEHQKSKPGTLTNSGRTLLSTESSHGITDMMGIKDSRSKSVVEELLFDIYDRWHYGHRSSFDSDTFTECSSTSDAFVGRSDMVQLRLEEQSEGYRLSKTYLATKDVAELKLLRQELQRHVTTISARLIRHLKRKDRRLAKQSANCDIITAVLQASSQKRRVDSQIRFTIKPQAGDDGFAQWLDAMRAVARLPLGLPHEFRKKVWLALADNHLDSLHIDWEKTKRFAFNERSNPDDNKLGLQIVKDLHRTGCSGFSGQDNEEERALLKRVLLAYARWNKEVGYCQGFNILAALILDVMERHEDDALKVMIYLIDHVLPTSYFANNLRALSVDMAVFRDLLKLQLPQLAKHLDHLQAAARDDTTGANYEPPLTNVFTMQWFLTLFATCLPKDTALRIWDSVLLEGSEIMLRTALAIWSKLESRILAVEDADEFYTTMGVLTQEMLDSSILNADSLIKSIYTMAPFPFPQLGELREKYTYNITPFSAAMSTGGQRSKRGVTSIFSDDDDFIEDDEMLENLGCFAGMFPPKLSPSKLSDADRSPSNFDISKISPGAYAATPQQMTLASSYAERMNLDLSSLKKQYTKVRLRQKQAHIILSAANARHQANLNQHQGRRISKGPMSVKVVPATVMAPIESPVPVNHLYLGRTLNVQQKNSRKNRTIVEAPKIASLYGEVTKIQQNPGHKSKSKYGRNRSTNSTCSNSSSGSNETTNGFNPGSLQYPNRSMSIQSIDSDVSAPVSSQRGSTLSGSNSDVSTICGDCDSNEANCDDVFQGREHELCDKEVNEETGEVITKDSAKNALIEVTDHCEDNLHLELSSSQLSTKEERHNTQSSHSYCDIVVQVSESSDDIAKVNDNDENILESNTHIDNRSNSSKAVRPNSLSIEDVSKGNSAQSQSNRKVTLHHVYPNRDSSESESESLSASPNRASPSKSKVYNPFPSQHINRRRAENGIKLGLYSAENLPKLELGMARNRPLQNIGRQQINVCLHRQYMAEVKKQGSVAK